MESRFDGHLIDRLMSAGHDVEVLPDAYSDTMGHAGAVVSIRTARSKARTTRAPTAARRGFNLRKSVKRGRVLDQDAVARRVVRRPVGEQIEQHRVVGLVAASVGCGQSLPHTMRSGAAAT